MVVKDTAPSTTTEENKVEKLKVPDDAVDVSGEENGGVLKSIKRAGQGDSNPSPGDSCIVHYVGKLEDGTKFDSSRDRDEPFSFNVGRSQVIKGWDAAVPTMKKGELCEIFVKPEFAYGEAGSPPKIPPNATLIFEIELLYWEGEDISPDKDKTITRTVQKDGEKAEYPNDGSHVTVEIMGFYDGKPFTPMAEGELQFVIGEASEVGLPEGVDKALKRFRRGERSCVHLKPRWGYGRNGNQQYGVPPDAELDFEIWLKDFKKCKESWQMDKEDKLAEAIALKERGAYFFQQGKNKLAATKYKRILDLLQHENRYEGADKEKRDSIHLAAHNNLAMIFLRTGETFEAIKHCSKVLEEDPKNIKALYRLGRSYQNQNDFEEAIREFKKLLELEPENKAAQEGIIKCKNGIAETKKKQKAVFTKVFDKMAKSPSKEEPASKSQSEKKLDQSEEGNTGGNPAKKEDDIDNRTQNEL